jgi:ROK family
VNLTILNGKRKGELQAFFRFMLSKISARPALAWVRIEGSTFLIYDIGYFNPICRGLQSHAANKVHAYDPEVIVIGGGVMERADIISPYIEAYVQKYAWTPWGKVQVRRAELANNAALVGAVPLISERIS